MAARKPVGRLSALLQNALVLVCLYLATSAYIRAGSASAGFGRPAAARVPAVVQPATTQQPEQQQQQEPQQQQQQQQQQKEEGDAGEQAGDRPDGRELVQNSGGGGGEGEAQAVVPTAAGPASTSDANSTAATPEPDAVQQAFAPLVAVQKASYCRRDLPGKA